MKYQPNPVVLWWIYVLRSVMLQSGSVYNNHNQISASKYVSWAEQAWQ